MAQRRDPGKDIVNIDASNDSGRKSRPSRSSSSADVFSFSVLFSPSFPGGFGGAADGKTMEQFMTQSKNQYEKFSQEAGEIGRESMDAYIKAGTLFMKGLEDIARTAAAMAQSSAEKQAEFIKEAMSSKTLNEWTEIQNKAAQANFDDFMSGATQLSELSVKVITECTEPLNAQMSKSIKRASESMAA